MNENETREALEAVRKDAKDPTLAVGDIVFCRGVYATVTGIHTYAPGMHDDSPIRNDWEGVEVATDTGGSRWHGIEPEAPQSGYTPCACRDCPDVTVSSDASRPELCAECKEAGCTAHSDLPGFMTAYGLGNECQRDDAYGEA